MTNKQGVCVTVDGTYWIKGMGAVVCEAVGEPHGIFKPVGSSEGRQSRLVDQVKPHYGSIPRGAKVQSVCGNAQGFTGYVEGYIEEKNLVVVKPVGKPEKDRLRYAYEPIDLQVIEDQPYVFCFGGHYVVNHATRYVCVQQGGLWSLVSDTEGSLPIQKEMQARDLRLLGIENIERLGGGLHV